MSNLRHALYMHQYDISMIVFTTQNEMNDIIADCEKMPLSQVRSIHKKALVNARSADKYFDKYPDRLQTERQKYSDFVNDCAIVAITGNIGFDKPVHLVHPSVIDKINWDPKFDTIRTETGDITVDLDPNIQMLQ